MTLVERFDFGDQQHRSLHLVDLRRVDEMRALRHDFLRAIHPGSSAFRDLRASRFQYGDFASNTLSFLKGEFAAEYRRTISRQTHEAHHRKARLGHVTGGRVFGYDNVERVRNTEEEAVVRRIFDLCATGAGCVDKPRPQRSRAASRALSRRAGVEPHEEA